MLAEQEFVCQSLPLAAWLKLKGHSYEIQRDTYDSSRAVFVFPRSAELDQHINEFQTDQASIAPRRFKSVEVELRNEMFAVLRGGGQ